MIFLVGVPGRDMCCPVGDVAKLGRMLLMSGRKASSELNVTLVEYDVENICVKVELCLWD